MPLEANVMKIRKLLALLTLATLLMLCLTAAAWAAMSDSDFVALCKEGTVQEIRAVLLKGAKPNAKNDGGRTALMMVAAHNKNPEVITALINAGADVNAKNEYGDTAIDHA